MIQEYSDGRMTIDGKTYRKDLKIIANRVIPNNLTSSSAPPKGTPDSGKGPFTDGRRV
jgi:hypothetical protein